MGAQIRTLAVLVGGLLGARPLVAQTVDYSALQETFGEPVTTSVTGKPQRASEAPASLTIITRDQIRRAPARSVPDLLKAFAGIDVNRWTAGQSDVTVRGGAQTYSAQLLVLVNGRQVYLDHYGLTNWNLLGVQLEEIQQIEIVRGPAGALFGFNAARGVINIVTVDPSDRASASMTVEGGNHDYLRASGVASIPLRQDADLQVSFGHQREDERALPTRYYRPERVDDVVSSSAATTLVLRPNDVSHVELNGSWSRNTQLELLPSQVLAQQRFVSRTAGLLVERDTPWGGLSGRAYATWLKAGYGITNQPTDIFSAIGSVRLSNRIVVTQGSALLRLDEVNTARLGVEYRTNQLYSDQLQYDRVGYQVASLNGMVDLHPSGGVSLTLAGRVDRLALAAGGAQHFVPFYSRAEYDRSLTRASFNAALLVDAGENAQLRINGGRGVQSPPIFSFGGIVEVPFPGSPISIYVTGDPAIRPATVWSGEAGFTRRFGAFHVDGTLFYNHTSNAIATPGDPLDLTFTANPTPAGIARFANVGSFRTLGLELSAGGAITTNLKLDASYTLTRTRQNLPADRTPYTYAYSPRDTTPSQRAALTLDYSNGGWSGVAVARYLSGTRQFMFATTTLIYLDPVKRAVSLDAKLARQLTRSLSAYVAGDNLTKARGAYGSPISADRRMRAGLSFEL